jgi:hypothetical protein
METERPKASFWQTAPGILTAGGTFVVALTGLLGALHQAGFLGGESHKADRQGVQSDQPAKSTAQAMQDTAGPGSTEWLSQAQYQHEFDAKIAEGFYPRSVLGQCQSVQSRYKAEWQPLPDGASFASHHAMPKNAFDERNGKYLAEGYTLESLNHFTDCSGVERYQGTWLKK